MAPEAMLPETMDQGAKSPEAMAPEAMALDAIALGAKTPEAQPAVTPFHQSCIGTKTTFYSAAEKMESRVVRG